MSGQPIDIVDSAAGSFYFGANSGLSRPSWAPGATRDTATSNVPPGYFFNPFAFVRPVVQTGQLIPSSNGTAVAGAQGTDIGNVGRNVLRGPRQTNVDFSVIKRFPFGEAKTSSSAPSSSICSIKSTSPTRTATSTPPSLTQTPDKLSIPATSGASPRRATTRG